MVQTDLAYTAGIIDGEGCISFRRIPKKGWPLQLIVVQKDLEVVSWLQEKWGGTLKPVTRAHRARVYWRWVLFGRDAVDLLEQCLPYLLLKKGQAEAVIRMKRLSLVGTKESRQLLAEIYQEYRAAAETERADTATVVKRQSSLGRKTE